MSHRILIAGFGNSLVGDDGLGPAVVARLRELGVPSGVRAEDCGSDALHLPGLWDGEPEVWLVDAIESGAAAATIRRLSHSEVLAVRQRHATAHTLSLAECLRWIPLAYPEMATVRYRFWGVEVERLALVEALTPSIAAAVEELTAELLRAAREATGAPCGRVDRNRR